MLSITWQQARHEVADLNTIVALTYHINYLVGILNVFKGGLLEIKDQYSFDLPPIHSKADWNELVEEFLANSAAFGDEVTQMPDEKLDQVFVNTLIKRITCTSSPNLFFFKVIKDPNRPSV